MNIVDVTLRESVYTPYCISIQGALNYISCMAHAGIVDFIEIGYINNIAINERVLGEYCEQYIQQCRTIAGNRVFLSAMLSLEQFSPGQWNPEIISKLDMVRLNVKNSVVGLSDAIKYFHTLNTKVSVNISYISKLSLSQFTKILAEIAKGGYLPEIFYIADSNGRMVESEIASYVELVHKFLSEVQLGIHAHNHTGLALSNSLKSGMWDYIDASINGFGKGAGNTNLEYLVVSESMKSHNKLNNQFLYGMYLCIKYFNEEIIKSPRKDYIEMFENLLCAYKNLSYDEINKYKFLSAEERIRSILNVDLHSRIEEIIRFVVNSVPYYRERKKCYLGDFSQIPLLTKAIYQKNVPPISKGLLSRSMESCFVFSTTGSTKAPQFIVRDVADIEYQENDYIGLNIGPSDIVLNLFWPGIWGIYTTTNIALSKLGATIIPWGGLDVNYNSRSKIIDVISKFKVNVLCGVPSTIIAIADLLSDYPECRKHINKIFCVGEKIPIEAYNKLFTLFNAPIIKLKYGCMESAGIGYQCKDLSKNQYHVYKNRLVEILDIATETVLPMGQIGKIVVTTLDKRLIPLIRYETGDLGCLKNIPCACGEGIVLEVMGRQYEDIIVGSVHIHVRTVLGIIAKNSIEYVSSQIIVDTYRGKDRILFLILAKEINSSCIINEMMLAYPDLQFLLNNNVINPLEIKKSKESDLVVKQISGKTPNVIDRRE